MDQFNEEHSKTLLAKEWLVKVDAQTSTPYLIKFHSSTVDLTCCILITDTKRTWAEVLSSKQFARRWRQCNKRNESPSLDEDDEEAWRTRHIDLLSKAHTLGGISELSFEIVASNFGDLAFELECNTFKWRWETIFVGHNTSADILSKHLIMPLISVNHLAFSSSDVVGNLPPSDLEKAIDKVARTARRTVDTHVKNALSKPRLATTIRRITAVFNFISDPPGITTEADTPVLLPAQEPPPKISTSPECLKSTHTQTPEPNVGVFAIVHLEPESPKMVNRTLKDRRDTAASISKGGILLPSALSREPSPINKVADPAGSATESEGEEEPPPPVAGTSAAGVDQPRSVDVRMRSPTPSRKASPSPSPPPAGGAVRSRSLTKGAPPPPSDTDSSPVRPIKKAKPRVVPSSDEDSEEERKKIAAQIRNGGAPSRGGVRQPIKRGGKRF